MLQYGAALTRHISGKQKSLHVLLEERGLHAAGGKREKVTTVSMTSEFPGVSVGRAKPRRVPALGVAQSFKEEAEK